MASLIDQEQFTLISTTTTPPGVPKFDDSPFGDFQAHSDGTRVATPVALSTSLRARHPNLTLAITQSSRCDLLGFVSAGLASAVLDARESLILRTYLPPARQLNGEQGSLAGRIMFAKYAYRWEEHDFIVYIAEGYADGAYGLPLYTYILCEPTGQETAASASTFADALILVASKWSLELHGEVWVFDQMFWQKNSALWEEVQKASWEDVILDEEMKQTLQDDIEGFYDERDSYEKFQIPWKRGIIFYGPPGNGKTISIKAMMKTLSNRPKPVATLYVKSLGLFNPEYSIRSVFQKARNAAPCLLIFEDVDSIITPQTRSYFLNEVDGLEDNGGILMLGSTNHLELLDPGISRRPSRFDRKYLFPLPSLAERTQYCEYWRGKLASNPEIEFPRPLCAAIANITGAFSFAYMKEAFVASLLALVVRRKEMVRGLHERGSGGGDLDDLPLWKEIQKQVKNLRRELEMGNDGGSSGSLDSTCLPIHNGRKTA
ncbi:hypothetical protein MMC11_000658 [Xylographa trunciseda]|nr:hypothetical protein [Xylographa trunciseda]